MGASIVIHILLRLGEAICAITLVAILGTFTGAVRDANDSVDARIIYALVVACLGVVFSLVFFPPFTYSFRAFPVDLIMFVCALVAFCLMETLTGVHTCDSVWYWSYWGFHWGRFWRRPGFVVTGPSDIGHAGCGAWKAALAWMFIMSMGFLVSMILGAYVVAKEREEERHSHEFAETSPGTVRDHEEKRHSHDFAGTSPDIIRGPTPYVDDSQVPREPFTPHAV